MSRGPWKRNIVLDDPVQEHEPIFLLHLCPICGLNHGTDEMAWQCIKSHVANATFDRLGNQVKS